MFGLKKKSSPYGVIIDVHSGSVGISLIESSETSSDVQILFTHREYIKILENPDSAGLVRAIRHALFAASLVFSESGQKILREQDDDAWIHKVMFICGAPWANTVTRFIHVEDTEPFTVSEEKVRALITEAERRDEHELQASTLLKELNISLVERAVINTAVNGYLVHEPYGKKGTSLSLAHISGLIPQAILDTVRDIEEKLFPDATTSAHTFALVLFCVIRDLFPKVRHALCVDISGEATELAIMQDETLMETCVFPFGTHTFVRMVALELNTFPDEALGHLRSLTADTPLPIQEAIKKVTDAYTAELTQALALLEARYTIPRHIYALTSRELHNFFDPILTSATDRYRSTHGSYTSLNATLLGNDEKAKDVFFVLESRFFHKMHACGEIY